MEFNPIKETVNGKKALDVIWSTSTLEKAIDGLNSGKKLVANPFYENNTKLLKGDITFSFTEEEQQEWKKCRKDILYFANRYCKLMTPQGIKNVEMRDYQEEYLKHLVNNRLSIFLSCRQSGKTTTSAIFLLHYMLFNKDKNSLVLGNKRRTAVEILDKIKNIFYELPYFLKPGIYKWNESEIAFDNKCRILAEATTINSGISFTLHCVLADEFAHIAPNILDKFYNNLFPTITAGKARFIISSTQNGYNLFYRLYKSAESTDPDEKNEYAPFKVDWWQVPEWNPEKQCWEKRDEKWHKIQVANYGSEEAFNRQFGTNFDVSSNTLIDNRIIKEFQQKVVEYKSVDMPGVLLKDYFKWHPMFEPCSELGVNNFVITVDISEGGGNDYTVFQFNKMRYNDKNEIEYDNVGYFRCNSKEIKECAKALRQVCVTYMDINRYCISIELNMYGDLFVRMLHDEIESNPGEMHLFNEDVIVKYYNESGTKFTEGVKITHGSKTKACMLFKSDYEHGKITNYDACFLNEIMNFCDINGNSVYKAQFGHDDMVMAQIQLELAKETGTVSNLVYTMNANKEGETDNFDIYGSYSPYQLDMYGNGGGSYYDYFKPNQGRLR